MKLSAAYFSDAVNSVIYIKAVSLSARSKAGTEWRFFEEGMVINYEEN